MTLQKKIDGQPLTGEDRPRHLDAEAPGEFPVPSSASMIWSRPRTRVYGRCRW